MTIAQLLKHNFKSKDSLYFYNSNGKEIYYENSNGYWWKREYDDNGNESILRIQMDIGINKNMMSMVTKSILNLF
jgi:hypothetical protein